MITPVLHNSAEQMKQIAKFEEFLKSHDGGKVLDIACGGGVFTRRLTDGLKSYISVLGLDIKSNIRDEFIATAGGHDVTFVQSKIHDFLTTEQAFDTISMSNALHHLEGVGDVLSSLKDILNPAGTVIINELFRDGLSPAQQIQHEQHRFLARLHTTAGEFHREAYTRSEIRDLITSAGLAIQNTFESSNRDAPITRTPGRLITRAHSAMQRAYPNGPPREVKQELGRLTKRNTEVGTAPAPQLALVCSP